MLYGMFLRMLHGEEQLNEDVLEKVTFVSLCFLLLAKRSFNWNILKACYG